MWRTSIRAAALAAALLFAGCGGGGSSGEGDPATAVPADALFYAEAVVRPEGSQRDDALDAAGKVLRTDDPEARIRELLRDALDVDDFDYESELQPWLGERAGLWGEPDGGAWACSRRPTPNRRSSRSRRGWIPTAGR